jgi:DNA-binding LacI/PurR family transcriptional regulator
MEPAKRRATILEVAKRANVAFSTVSRVMNGGGASLGVKERVQRAAKELGYTPSSIARNLKMGRQGCIGVIVESSQGSWFTEVLGGIEEALADKSGSALLLSSLSQRGQYHSTPVAGWIAERRVDGLIFARCTRREADLVERARAAHIPMVFVGPDEHFGAGPVFVSRNTEAARALGEHLLSLGHRRFGFLGGPETSADVRDRLRGLEEVLAAHGLGVDPAHRAFADAYVREAGVSFGRRWLELPRASAPTAIVCANDLLAIAFLRTVLQRRVLVPEDVSVVGFDGVAEGALYWPGLTTARQASHDMGAAACRALLRTIAGDPTAPLRVEMNTELVVRESSGPAPA